MDQIRINELARELEVKSKGILDYLTEIGTTEKKTHSSSIDNDLADKVRAHFRAEEAAAQAAAAAEQVRVAAEKEAAERAARARAAAEAEARRAAEAKAAEPVPAPPPRAPAPTPSPTRPTATAASARPAEPRRAPAVRPGEPPARPRLSPRGVLARPGPVVPTPGQPIYQPKPTPRRPAKTHLEKRFEEGERKLTHPVRARAKPEAVERKPIAPTAPVVPVRTEPLEITITEGITVKELAEKLEVRVKDVIKVLFDRGILATINQTLDSTLAKELSGQFNAEAIVITFEEQTLREVAQEQPSADELQPRPPVVTVMGHVDHGKTLLLDAIRETNRVAEEAGGITQHIGAYQVEVNSRRIVFIDTPGHEAFTRMRARGAKVTDLVVLVVAADDGVMAQTLEAVDHARAARVPILVAVNKIDIPGANPDRVKKQLAKLGLNPEEWGGDTVTVEVSAKQKTNINLLLEMILLVADLQELRAAPDRPATGVVLEAKLDKGRGPMATVLVQSGTLRVGDPFICGAVYGKVRAMLDDRGRPRETAAPSTPAEVLGLDGLPQAGDVFQVVSDEVKAKQMASYREQKEREVALAQSTRVTLDQLQEELATGTVKELRLVVKADVQGSVEALTAQLEQVSTEKVKVEIIHSGVGGINETDVLLAAASSAIIIGFNVRPDRKAAELAQQEGVDIRLHDVIYDVLEEIRRALAGMLEPVVKETFVGRAEVRETFRIPKVGTVAGCYVLDGKIVRDGDVRLIRDHVVIYQGKVASLRRFKNDVNEVRSGYECGVAVSNFSDIKVGDILETFAVEKVTSEVSA
ncbi:MAG: translation initiation factor IF-2 [Acidobacteria bacterium]|nr:translation initiation factor IF-2 [Acidobacteriota bacterium]